ncbi:hypothetical protein K438DRAFT_1677273, partial [Mycena galopus ATCC 62051]
MAILRRFAFDHPELKDDKGSSKAADRESQADEDNDDDNEAQPPARKKARISKPSGGRIEDFWGQVDEYFRIEMKKRGTSLTGAQWKPYID